MRHLPIAAAGRCYGRLDLAAAVDDGGLLARLVQTGAATVWSSPASRCLALARPAAERLGVALRVDERLQELDFGAWEGLLWEAIPRADLDRWAADPVGFAPPGGESGGALLGRVAAFAAALRRRDQPCLVVSHGGPLRLLPALLRDEPPDLLAAPPAPGAMLCVHASRLSTTHSASTEPAPSTSPV